MTADTTYFPFLRTGFPSAISTLDGPAAAPFVSLTATATVNGAAGAAVSLRLAGPGEIRGLTARTVVRNDPAAGAMGVPPNLFAAVELRPADLPWMFTPLGATGDVLRPWLCLVVTDLDDAEPVIDASRPLPMLHVPHPDRALPDPREAWAWAHVAVAGEQDAGGLQATIGDHPEQVVARLLCPRRLAPERRYVAALVPLFEGGRCAGLGLPVDDTAALRDAWTVAAGAAAVDLPVYYSWTFTTGVGGDFRSLALRLKGHRPPDGAGSRPMDITHPGGGLDPLPATAATPSLGLEGALQPDGFCGTDWDAAEQAAFEQAIAGLVDAGNIAGGALGPPLWGRWHAAQPTVPATLPSWLRELNVDPRTRAAAGLGARVVHEQRERLMAQAWQQVGAIERANQRLRQAQLARAQGKSRHVRALPALSDGAFLQLTRPLQDRVRTSGQLTALGEIAGTSFPARLLDGAFRRLARPRGPLGRGFGRHQRDPGELVEKAAAGTIAAAPADVLPKGSPQVVASVQLLPPALLQQLPGLNGWMPPANWMNPDPSVGSGPDTPVMSAFRQAVVAYATWFRSTLQKEPVLPALDPADLRGRMTPRLDPDVTVVARTAAVVEAPLWDGAGDPLQPIMAAPRFPQPMSAPLMAISQELILPGLGAIPAESVTAAVPNARFIESYLVGLNHEMSRELLFREFPTDLRGTYFRQFWDVRGRVPAPPPGSTDDIGDIDRWDVDSLLGAHLAGTGSGLLVVIIRGELLRRYPDAALYATPAAWTTGLDGVVRRVIDPAGAPLYPELRGRLDPDLVYLGFQLTADDARGATTYVVATDAPGWFIVFEQHPIQPHYGLDAGPEGTAGTSPAGWDQVSWADVTPASAAALDPRAGAFVPAAMPAWWTWPGGPTDPSWGASSASMAAITLQRPTRLALHASDLLAS